MASTLPDGQEAAKSLTACPQSCLNLSTTDSSRMCKQVQMLKLGVIGEKANVTFLLKTHMLLHYNTGVHNCC